MEQSKGNEAFIPRSPAEMNDLLRKYEDTPGLTAKAFCELHRINLTLFYSARSRYRSSQKRKVKSSGFIPLSSPANASTLFAEVNGIRIYQFVPADYLKALVP